MRTAVLAVALLVGADAAAYIPATVYLLDKLVDEYNIPIGIHNHGPGHRFAKIDTIASTERVNSNPTRCPGPAPTPASRCANRFDASSSSR